MRRKKGMSLFITVALLTAGSLGIFAAPTSDVKASAKRTTEAPAAAEPQADLSGTLTGTGLFRVNGNTVQSGATVMNGSVVTTDSDGDVVLDLGDLGRIKLRPRTEIKLLLEPGKANFELRRCGSYTQTVPQGVTVVVRVLTEEVMQVATTVGEVRVEGQLVVSDDTNAPPPNTATPGKTEDVIVRVNESRAFDEIEQVTANGETTYTVNCCDCEVPAAFYLPLPYTLLALGGVTAGVIIGVTTLDPSPRATPIR